MSRDAEIILQMGASLCINESIGKWDNYIKYSDGAGNETVHQYSIQVFADYVHAFYHIGIGIDVLANGFETHAKYIKDRAETIAMNVSVNKLNSVPMHFSGLILIGSDSIKIEEHRLCESFNKLGMAIRVYDTKSSQMPAVIPELIISPEIKYSGKLGNSEIVYQTPDYMVWIEEDGTVGYALQMRLRERFRDERTVLSDLSKLSPYRENISQYLHSKQDRRKISNAMTTALRDGLEGRIDDAIETLKKIENRASKNAINKSKILVLMTSLSFIGVLLTIMLLTVGFDNARFVAPVWGMIGAALALWMPASRLDYLARYSFSQAFVDVLVRLIIGAIAGIVVVFLIESQILFGFVDVEAGGLVYLVAMVVGWSERLLPELFSKLEDNIIESTETKMPS